MINFKSFPDNSNFICLGAKSPGRNCKIILERKLGPI